MFSLIVLLTFFLHFLRFLDGPLHEESTPNWVLKKAALRPNRALLMCLKLFIICVCLFFQFLVLFFQSDDSRVRLFRKNDEASKNDIIYQ